MRRSMTLATALLATTTFNPTFASADERPTWSLQLQLDGHPVVGEFELMDIPVNRDPTTLESAAASAVRPVRQLSKFKLSLFLRGPDGSLTDVTGSPLLTYRPKNCLRVTQSGMAEVLGETEGCFAGDPAPLSVIYANHAEDIAAINMYLFKVDAP